MPVHTEKVTEWVLKIATAFVIPTLAWTFKVSNDMSILKERVAVLTAELGKAGLSSSELTALKIDVAVNKETLKGVQQRAKDIQDALRRIEDRLGP